MAIQTARPALPASLNDRAADIWEPLLVLADLAGGRWPGAAREAAQVLNEVMAEEDFGSMLLGDIQKVFQVLAVDKIFSRHLVEALTKIQERPWREARRGGPINELWLAQQLSPFGIHSRAVRIGATVGKGYSLEDFGDAFARYGEAGSH